MGRKNKRLWAILVIVGLTAMVGLCFFAPAAAFARAGGGDHFGGGDSGGGGGHSGGGGDEGLFYLVLVIFRLLPFPYNVIAVVIVVVAFGAAKRKRARGRSGSVVNAVLPAPVAVAYSPPPAPAVMAAPPAVSLADLKSRDPNFSEQQFEDMASTSFFKIQEAWGKKDMSLGRAFVSPTLLQRFEVQLNELKKLGRENRIEQLTVGALDIVEAVHEGALDYVTVRIDAAAADYTVDAKTGKIVAGDQAVQRFSEYWTFLRSEKVQTVAGQEVVSQKCPNCGAPIKLNAVGKCEYCSSDVTSGAFSWVLSEISQPSVWRPRSQAVRPQNISPLAGGRYVLGLVQCPNCGANVQDIAGVTNERCWRCGGVVPTVK